MCSYCDGDHTDGGAAGRRQLFTDSSLHQIGNSQNNPCQVTGLCEGLAGEAGVGGVGGGSAFGAHLGS